MTALSTAHPDVITADMSEVFHERIPQIPSRISELYSMGGRGPRGDQVTDSSEGTMEDWGQFSGSVEYDDIFQGYDVTATHLSFVRGFQLEQELLEDDRQDIFNRRPRALASSYARTREGHGARPFNNAFSVDSFFYNHTEGVALSSNSHTTTSGASTSIGFDNYVTTPLSATAVSAARILMEKFRDDRANRTQVSPDELLYPIDLFEAAEEIAKSFGKVGTDLNNINVNEGVFKLIPWKYLTDVNNWFMMDGTLRSDNLLWVDRVPVGFDSVQDFDTIVHKWRGRARYSNYYRDWRWILGAEVS